MKVLLLGAGAQGKATLYDLLQNPDIKQITVVEYDLRQIKKFVKKWNDDRIILMQADANDKKVMIHLMKEADIIIDLLPTIFRKKITVCAIEAKTNIVNTSYQANITSLAKQAYNAGIIIMPEAGLDPGIDLVLAGNAVKQFDEVHEFHSACGGVPVKEACDNPINYKISWAFEGVLSAYKRPAKIIVNGKTISIPGNKIFDYAKEIRIPKIGKMDRIPNGNTEIYAELLGIKKTIKNMGRYSLRWPGHAEFWKKIVDLGLIDDDPVLGISPRKYMAKVLEPRLQYKDNEQDLIVLRNEMSGIKNKKKLKIVQQVIDRRDLDTGFMAMNRTVGFTASIVAQMILKKQIIGKGILNPATDIPYELFIKELNKRKIIVTEEIVKSKASQKNKVKKSKNKIKK